MRLTRSLVALVGLAAGFVLATAQPAAADTCNNAEIGSVCNGIVPGTTDPGTEETSNGGDGPSQPVDYELYFDEEGTGVDAEAGYEDDGCWGIQAVPEGTGGSWAEAVEDQNAQGQNGVLWGNCEVEETIDPAVVAQAYWYRAVVPPPPSPLEVNDDHGVITGLPAYLEIGGEVPFVQSFGTPIGTLTFTLTPRYVVSWGDGESVSTTSQGGPYPDGDLTHTYTEDVPVTLTVEAFWTASWTLAGASGNLPEHPVSTSDDLGFVVEQYQAVIDPE